MKHPNARALPDPAANRRASEAQEAALRALLQDRAALQARVEELGQAQSRMVVADVLARSALEREIHDVVQQRLLASALDLSTIEAATQDGGTRRLVVAARDDLLDLVGEVRRLLRSIRPVDLSQSGVSGALEGLAEHLGIHVRLRDLAGRLPAVVEATAYSALTEALINSVTHAAGATVEITLTRHEGLFVGRVCDDGPGGAMIVQGGGLAAQRDRIHALRGCVTLESNDSGTTVEVSMPCM